MINIFQKSEYLSQFIHESKRVEFFSKRLKYIFSNIHLYINKSDFDLKNTSSIYYFNSIKKELFYLLSSQIDEVESNELLTFINKKLDIRNILFDILIKYGLKDLIFPFFLWIDYYHINNYKELDINLNFLKSKNLNFTSLDELFNYGRNNTYFILPYINPNNNKNNLIKICQFMRHICSDLNYNNLHKRTIKTKNKIRIGFYSERLKYDSSVLRDRMGIISNLDRNKFEVFIFVSENEQYYLKNYKGIFVKPFFNKNKDDFVFLPKSLKESRNIINFLELDILLYCELGMDYKPYLLSFSRLAPIQINTWGHSETSGIDTIDYYFSSKYFESQFITSQKYYSETLVLMDSLSTCYPNLKDHISLKKFKTRKELNFKETDNIYCCLQASFKISNFMIDIFNEILNKDKNGIILLSIAFAPFSKKFLEKIHNKLNINTKRLKFYKMLSLVEYLNLKNISNIVLDPYPFGGCNSCLESFYLNKPVVTLPTKKINGRFTYGFYKKMNIYECIVLTKEDYVNKCLKLIQNKEYYNNVCKKIENKKYLLFEEIKSVREYENKLIEIKMLNNNKYGTKKFKNINYSTSIY